MNRFFDYALIFLISVVDRMQLLTRYLAFLFLGLSATASANLNEKNQALYPNLARAASYCLESNDPAIQGINWEAVNSALEQPDSSNSACWLENHSWWSLSDHQSFFGPALWLLPDANAWGAINNINHQVFMQIIQFYYSEFFHRINVFELLELLKSNENFGILLSHLLQKSEHPYLIRFILQHLQQLSSLALYSQENYIAILNAASSLNWLIRHQQQLKLSDQFITGLLNWVLTRSSGEMINLIMDVLKNIISNQPNIIATLNTLSPYQLQQFLNLLTENPDSLIMPSSDDAAGIALQAAVLQDFIDQAQQLGQVQIEMINAAIQEVEPVEPASEPQPIQPSDIMQSFIMEPPLQHGDPVNDLTVRLEVMGWELIQ